MKKMGAVFTVITAFLFFTISFTQFNQGYKSSQWTLFKQEQLENTMHVVNMSLSSESFNGTQGEFVDFIFSLFQGVPYDGVAVTDSNQSVNYYVSTEKPEALAHLAITRDLSDLNFKADNEVRYISNSIKNKDAYAYVVQFDRHEGIPKSDSFNSEVNYYPIALLKGESFPSDQIVGLNFFIPPERIESFKETLVNDYLKEHYSCDVAESQYFCGMIIGEDGSTSVLDQYMNLTLFTNPLEFPNPLLIISFFSLFTILLGINVAREREVLIRSLHGNNPFIIFKRLYLKTIFINAALFVGVFVILCVISIGFYNKVTLRFLGNLTKISGCFLGLMMLLSVIIFIFQMQTLNVTRLKKNTKNIFIGILIPCFKVIAIMVLMVPLMDAFVDYKNISNYHHALAQNEILKTGSMVSSIHYGYNTSSVERTKNDATVFELVEKYGLSYISSDHIMNRHDSYDYIVTNRHALKHETVVVDEHVLDIANLKENTLLVPESRHDVPMVDAEIISVKQTPMIVLPSFNGTSKNVRINEPILVIVKPDTMDIESITTGSIFASKDEKTQFDGFVDAIAENMIKPETVNLEDVFETDTVFLKQYRNRFVAILAATLLLSTIFMTLLLEVFISHKGSWLAITYIHGTRWFKRYGLIIAINLLTLLLPFSLIVIKRAQAVTEFIPMINVSLLALCFSVLLIAECLYTLYYLKRFERNRMLAMLKGDS